MDIQNEIFTKIYRQNLWGGKESKSGRGSDSDQTSRLIIKLVNFIQENKIQSMVDCPCGDMQWMINVLKQVPPIQYTGMDIVEDLINDNQKKYPSYKFIQANAISEPIPKADMIFCRDMLNHLTFVDIWKVLKNFVDSGSQYILLTNFIHDRQNVDLKPDTMGWRALNLYQTPFLFPTCFKSIVEGCPEKGFEDKSITVWKTDDIRRLIQKHTKHLPIVKKWELLSIPKVAYFYWDSHNMPFLRYATIASFKNMNPDWQVKLYVPEKISQIKWKTIEHGYDVKGKNYFDDVAKLDIEILPCPLESIGFDPAKLNGVFQSDILRWYLLSEYGGLWADMDIIFIQSMNELFLNKPENQNMDGTVCISNLFNKNFFLHSIGFILSAKGNKLYKWMLNQSKKVKNTDNYQCFGADLLNKDFPSVESVNKKFNCNMMELGLDTCYTYGTGGQIKTLHTNGNTLHNKTRDTIGIHWYAGSPHAASSINRWDADNYLNYQSPMCDALKLGLKK